MKMKKFAGIIAAAVMTVAMGLTAFAAPSPSASSVSSAKDAEGNEIKVSVSKADEKDVPSAEKVEELAGKGMEAVQTLDVVVPEGTKFPVTLTFPVEGVTANSKVAVLHLNNRGVWEKVEATAGDGVITATFNDLSPVSIVVDKTTLASASTATSTTAKTSTSATSSPKTGEASTVLMLGVVAVLAAGAVYGVSRKSRV